MGMADIAEVLWNDFLKHNPNNTQWFDRDRFILSNGHGSMLHYALLHLAGYGLSLNDLKDFRQMGSKTPGHPENFITDGIETTTGPLGQGIANGVGMAIAEKTLAATFNRDDHDIVDHHTYVFMGDGCLMEGISHEVCSLAGTLGLGKLVAFWDDNGISIDGEVEGWFSDDTPTRFEAYGWQVVRNVNGHDAEEIKMAIETAQAESAKPTLICCRTTIGFGSPNKAGTAGSHGAPLGDEEIALTREQLGWSHGTFEIPQDIYAGWDAKVAGAEAEQAWQAKFAAYKTAYPELAAEYERRMAGDLPTDWQDTAAAYLQDCNEQAAKVATRVASQNALNGYGPVLPELIGGSADLAGSNNTLWKGSKGISAEDPAGNYLYFGVREFGMAAIANGISLHGGFIPYTATFLVFTDYARNAMRMSALMGVRQVYVMTHDSIGLGEDGPTHQPVEHVQSLRIIPNMDVWRPCDTVESAVAWQAGVERMDGPVTLALTRQGLPCQPRTAEQLQDVARGGYVLKDCAGEPDVILIATGSEVALAMQAADQLDNVRVVSMPCLDVFQRQESSYQDAVLPPAVTQRVSIEAGVTDGWYRYIGTQGAAIGLDRFGASAPGGELMERFGFTVENIVQTVKGLAV